MNILTHAVHTGYQYDLAKTGHEFYSVDIPGTGEVFWDERFRPRPRNFHHLTSLEDPPVNFDLTLVHFGVGYHYLKTLDLPLIFKEHCLRPPFQVPGDWLDRISYYSFASQTAATNWELPPEFARRKIIIGMGMDLEIYGGYEANAEGILVVGQNIQSRGNEKGYDNLLHLGRLFKITVVGVGNEGMSGDAGPAADYGELKRYYKSHKIFLNPSNILGMSTLEAMATGVPVVTFRLVNSDVVRDGFNGYVVDNVDEASAALDKLMQDRDLCHKLGRNARETIRKQFSRELFVERWNALFRMAIHGYYAEPPLKKWMPFDIALKPDSERVMAENLVAQLFQYHRVGYDKRPMRFLRNGRVGTGAGGRELFWNIKIEAEGYFLHLSSGDSLTCRLKREADGTWRGNWLVCEKMPIILSPT